METTEAIKAIQTNEDEDIVGVSIQHQDVISSGLNEDDLPQEPVATVSSPGRRPKPQGFYALVCAICCPDPVLWPHCAMTIGCGTDSMLLQCASVCSMLWTSMATTCP